MTLNANEIADWQGHVGRTERKVQYLDRASLRRFAVAAGLDPDIDRNPPALAHWAWFADVVADAGLGSDGHPLRGGFLPAVRLPRRMFAASKMSFETLLTLDEEAELEQSIVDVRHRSGKTGDLVFVDVDRLLSQAGRVRVRERQTIVYREQGTSVSLPEVKIGIAGATEWRPSPVALFRFSAVTFNAHRIHYDRDYATCEEGYPDLVVHGPFAATKLAAFAERQSGRRLGAFAFRAEAPLFVSQPIYLEAGVTSDIFRVRRCDGVAAMTAEVAFR